MERNSGPYYLIQDLRKFKTKLGLDANEGEPQENEEDYKNNELYDKDIVFMFHSMSNSTPRPGKGSGEHIPDTIAFEYNKLNNIQDWCISRNRFFGIEIPYYTFEFHGEKSEIIFPSGIQNSPHLENRNIRIPIEF